MKTGLCFHSEVILNTGGKTLHGKQRVLGHVT